MSVLVHDPSFTYEAVRSGILAIGGVTSALEGLPGAKQNRYANIMRMVFSQNRETFLIISAGTVANVLGHEEYRLMLNEYRTYGQLSDTMKRNLMTKFNTARYVVFARIEKDEITQSQSEEIIYDDTGMEITGTKIILETTRSTDVSMITYDLWSGAIVWSGSVEECSSRSNSHVDRERINIFFEILMDIIFVLCLEYPEPESMDTQLEHIFSVFATNLPEEK
jgi:hypothetical protein